jgi:hypothetical protein
VAQVHSGQAVGPALAVCTKKKQLMSTSSIVAACLTGFTFSPLVIDFRALSSSHEDIRIWWNTGHR